MKVLKIFSILLFITACTKSKEEKNLIKIEYNQSVGDSMIAHKYGSIYFSGQPSEEDLKKLKAQGFNHIINLRLSTEDEYEEALESKMIQKYDINYSHIPFNISEVISDSYIDSVVRKIKAHRYEGKTLIHCTTGQRVSLFAGAHFFKDHGFSKTAALEMAKKMGLEKEALIDQLNSYTDVK